MPPNIPSIESPVRFVADLHLLPGDTEVARRFCRYLARLEGGVLCVLGDLFEFWLGDAHARLDDYAPVLEALQALKSRGVRLVLVHGNRDFLLGGKTARALNATVIEDAALLRLGGRLTLVTHGDRLCTADRRYHAMRRHLRRPALKALARHLPMALLRRIAALLRRRSRAEVAAKPALSLEPTARGLERAFATGAEVIIAGHVHRRMHWRTTAPGRSRDLYFLPAWDAEGVCLEARDGGFRFVSSPR